MVRVRVRDCWFALACLPSEKDALKYVGRLPVWVGAIYRGNGPQVGGILMDKRLTGALDEQK